MLKGISRKRLQNKQRSNDMKKITSKLVAQQQLRQKLKKAKVMLLKLT